jgi:hypothetical protein
MVGLLLAMTTPHWHERTTPRDSTKFFTNVTTTLDKVKHKKQGVEVPLFP